MYNEHSIGKNPLDSQLKESITESCLADTARKLWSALPDRVELVVASNAGGKIAIEAGNVLRAGSRVTETVRDLLRSWGKEVTVSTLPSIDAESGASYLTISAEGEKIRLSGYGAAPAVSFDRFDDSMVRLLMCGDVKGWRPNEKGLIGSTSSGRIRNTYLSGPDGSTAASLDAYVRARSRFRLRPEEDEISLISTPLNLSYHELFTTVFCRLSKATQFDRIVVVTDHFNDHLDRQAWSRERAALLLNECQPNASVVTLGTNNQYCYGRYPVEHESVREAAEYYHDDVKTLFLYDRHAWGIFKACERGDAGEDTWYHNPRSTASKIFLQMPQEDLLGSLVSAAATEEARQVFESAELTNPLTLEERSSIINSSLASLARAYLRERDRP